VGVDSLETDQCLSSSGHSRDEDEVSRLASGRLVNDFTYRTYSRLRCSVSPLDPTKLTTREQLAGRLDECWQRTIRTFVKKIISADRWQLEVSHRSNQRI
jgi:hypothetical protein